MVRVCQSCYEFMILFIFTTVVSVNIECIKYKF